MRLIDEYEYVAQMRHFQALFSRYRTSPSILDGLQKRFGLRRVVDSDPSTISPETTLQMSEWLFEQGDLHAIAWIASVMDLGAGNGLVYYLRAHSTLEQALAEMTRLAPMLFPDARFACDIWKNQVRLSFYPTGAERLGVLLRYEAICVWMVRVMQDITGGKASLTMLELMTHENPGAATLQELLSVTCLLGANKFSLSFSTSDMKLHLPGASEPLRAHLHTMFEKRILGFQRRNTIVRSVAQWLDGQPSLQDVRLETAAKEFGMGASTLRRQLADYGCSFSDIFTSYRAFMAIHALIHGDENSESIALRTGYADRNAFERAFKGWFDVSPAQCRKAARELLGRERNLDWGAPSGWRRFSPKLDWLKNELTQPEADLNKICDVIQSDPVLHARLSGFCAMPSQGARTRLCVTPELLTEIQSYALSTLVDGSVPFDLAGLTSSGLDAWRTSRIAVSAVQIISKGMIFQGHQAVEFAASVFNLGTLARPLAPTSSVEGIDVTWLLLASWHVPPSVLRMLRGRHFPQSNAEMALSLAISWAESLLPGYESERRHFLETTIQALCGNNTLGQLQAISVQT